MDSIRLTEYDARTGHCTIIYCKLYIYIYMYEGCSKNVKKKYLLGFPSLNALFRRNLPRVGLY